MKLLLPTILVAFLSFVTSCKNKSSGTITVVTTVTYSHPEQLVGGFTLTTREEAGTIGQKTPSNGQPMALTEKREVAFSQRTDASDTNHIRVIIESESDGFASETQILKFDTGEADPPAIEFKNGLKAEVTLSTYSK